MKKLIMLIFMAALFFFTGGFIYAMDGKEIIKKSQEAFYYPGKDMKARITMKLEDERGSSMTRELTMLRKNEGGENQKYFIHFHSPSDVKDMAFLIFKYPLKDDDRWMFIPGVNATKRIAAKDSRSSFAGSDFTYEDVSGRDLEADEHKLIKEENMGGSPCYVIESKPKKDAEYTKKLSWIDKTIFLPLSEKYYDVQGEVFRVFTADEIKDVDGIKTATRRTMKNTKRNHQTVVSFSKTGYNVGIEGSVFSEKSLGRPPAKWLK